MTSTLRMRRLERARFARLATAALAVLLWLGLGLVDLVLSAMFFSDPSPEILLFSSPLLLAAPWIAWMANARGRVEIRHDALVISHRRILRRPIVVPRQQVQRILLDDGAATGRARFATGDVHEPLLWTDPVPRRQRADRPLIGDGVLPNVAVMLHQPLPMDAVRDPITAVALGHDLDPPRRGTQARALLLSMEDLEAVRLALAGWPVEQSDAAAVIPPQVAAAAARVNADALLFVLLSAGFALLAAKSLLIVLPFWLGLSLYLVYRMQVRRVTAATEARAELDRRAATMSPAERATAHAAIEANLGTRSFGPPGRA